MRALLVLALLPLASAATNGVQGDGTVRYMFDTYWQHCAMGLSGDSCEIGTAKTYTYDQAVAACNNLKLAGRRWRLPELDTLQGDLLKKAGRPTIDRETYPNTPAGLFWTTTLRDSGVHYVVDFYEGEVTFRIDNLRHYVRCVS
jgi:hypothetical protein